MSRALRCALAAALCLFGAGTSGAQAGGDAVEAVVSADCDRYGCMHAIRLGPLNGARLDVALRQEGLDVLLSVAAPSVLLLRTDPRVREACTQESASAIRCRVPAALMASGAGRDDRLDASALSTHVRLEGGEGADELIGGAGDDSLAGGPGADRLHGGAGHNTLDLAGEVRDVVADLTSARVSTGDVVEGFEGVIGGSGDDLLIASPGGSRLTGGPGEDRLRGGPGRDRLEGGAGEDSLDGGGGGDVVVGDGRGYVPDSERARDRIRCGDGRDRADAPERSTVWIDCERVETVRAEYWLLRTDPNRVLIPRGIPRDFPATYAVVVRRPPAGRVVRRFRTRITTRERRRSPFFRVPLAGPVIDVAVAEFADGSRLPATTRMTIRTGTGGRSGR